MAKARPAPSAPPKGSRKIPVTTGPLSIPVRCDPRRKLRRVPAKNLKRFQRELKFLSPARRAALKVSIREEGFSAPVYIWYEHDYILDGHQRLEVIEEEGWEIEGDVPVVEIEAKTKEEAARKLLRVFTAVYGEVETEQLERFIEEHKISLEELEKIPLPDFDVSEFVKREMFGLSSKESEHEEETSPERFDVLTICKSEDEQGALIEHLTEKGYSCRALTS